MGRQKESQDALQRLRGKNADIKLEAAEIRVILPNFYFQLHMINLKILFHHGTRSKIFFFAFIGLY